MWAPTEYPRQKPRAGFSNTFDEFDLRPGGAWRFTMYGPDGAEYHNVSEFVEVVPLERIVFQRLKPIHKFQLTMTFAERSGNTVLTWQMRFESDDEATQMRQYILEGNEQNFDRLEAFLATMV